MESIAALDRKERQLLEQARALQEMFHFLPQEIDQIQRNGCLKGKKKRDEELPRMQIPTPIKIQKTQTSQSIRPSKPIIQSSWGQSFKRPPFQVRQEEPVKKRPKIVLDLDFACTPKPEISSVAKMHQRACGLSDQ